MLLVTAAFAGSIWTGGTPEAKRTTDTIGHNNGSIQRGGWSDGIDIQMPSAPNGEVPNVSLFADHGVVDGVMGSGWGLDATSTIERRSATGGVPTATTTDLFRLDGMDLYLTGTCFEPELQDDSCLEYDSETNMWLRRQDGYRWIYGEAQLIDPAGPNTLSNTASWHLVQTSDPYGNVADYDYVYAPMPTALGGVWGSDTNQLLLDSIEYAGGQVEVLFGYAERPDPRVDALGGTPVILADRLTDVSVLVGANVYSHYGIEYTDEAGVDCDGTTVSATTLVDASRVRRVTRTDGASSGISKPLRCATYNHESTNQWDPVPDANSGGVDYANSIERPLIPQFSDPSYTFLNHWNIPQAVNLNGDAFPDLIVLGFKCNPPTLNLADVTGPATMLDTPPGSCAVDHNVYINVNAQQSVKYWGEAEYLPDFDKNDPIAVAWEVQLESTLDASFAQNNKAFAIVDLDGDGAPELVYEDGTANLVTQFDAGANGFTPPVPTGIPINQANPVQEGAFADVDGDGLPDLVVGYAKKTNALGWTNPEWFRNQGNLSFSAESLQQHPVDAITFSSCNGQSKVPTNAVGNLPTQIFRSRQTHFTDINGDGLTDAVLALYECWDLVTPTTDPADNYEVPDETTARSVIFLGDGRGNFHQTDLSGGRPFMFEPNYTHYVLPYNNTHFYSWRNYFSSVDLNGSGRPELVQAGPVSSGAGTTLGVSSDYGIAAGFDFGPNSGSTTGSAVHFQEPSDYSIPIDGLGGQYPWPTSAVAADFDGDGFEDFLVFHPELDTTDADPEDFEFYWQVSLNLSDRQMAEGRLVRMDNAWGGSTDLVWGFSARHGGNSNLHINTEVLFSENGPDGEIRYRYSHGAHRARRFRGFGLVEVTNGRGSLEEYGFAVSPILEGVPVFSTAYRFDGTLAALTWNSYFDEWNGGYALDIFPPYFNPLQRSCDFDIDHGTWSGLTRVQSVSVDSLAMECLDWSTAGGSVSHEEVIAAIGWGASSTASEPADEAVWAGQKWEGSPTYSMLGVGGQGLPMSLGGLAAASSPVATTTPDAPGGIDHPTPLGSPADPDGGSTTQWDLFVTRWRYVSPSRLEKEYADRDVTTTVDDLVTTNTWGPRDTSLWAYQLLQSRTDDAAGAMQWRETYSSFAWLGLPQQVEECGLSTSTCRTWTYGWTSLQGITGDLYARTAPDGGQESWTRTWCGSVSTYNDPVGRIESTTYDALCRPVEQTWQGATTRWGWDTVNRTNVEEWETPNLDGSTTWIDQTTVHSDGHDPDVPRTATLRADGRLERLFADEWGRPERQSVCEWDGTTSLLSDDRSGPSPCVSGTNIESWLGYGTDGLLRERAGPYYEGSDTFTTLIERDGLGRPSVDHSPGHDVAVGWETTQSVYRPGQIIVTDPLGRETIHWADTLGGEVQVSGTTTLMWEVDAWGDMLWVEDFDGTVTEFQVDDFHRRNHALLSTQEPCVNATNSGVQLCDKWAAWDYDAMDRVVRVVAADGTATAYTYDTAGRVVAEDHDNGTLTRLGTWQYTDYPSSPWPRVDFTAELGAVTIEWYDGFDRLHERQDVVGVTSWTYSGWWSADSQIDPDNIELAWTYDVHDRAVETTRLNDGVITRIVEFDADGQPAVVEDADGVIDEYWYTYSRQLQAIDRGAWVLEEHAYDAAGRRIDTTTRGLRQTVTLDDWDRPDSIDYGDPSVPEWTEQFTWSGSLPTTRTLSPVHTGTGTTSYTYDSWSRLTDVAHPDGSSETYEYDARGQMRFHVDEEGGEDERRWDSRGRLVYAKDSGQASSAIQYLGPAVFDGVSNLLHVEERDGLGNTWDTYIDEGGRTLGEVAPDATSRSYSYGGTQLWVEEARDKNGSALARRTRDYNTSTGQLEWVWGWFDDPSWYSGKLPSSADYVTDYTWTDAGRLDSIATPDETTEFTYADGLLETEEWGGTQTRTLTRSGAYPWVTSETRTGTGNARTTTYSRDTAGRVVSQTVSHGTASLVNSWSNLDARHQPQFETSQVDGVTAVVHDWDYDSRGWPSQRHTTVHGVASGTTTWEWYLNGTSLTVGLPSGRVVGYARSLSGGDWELDDVTVNGAIEATITARDLNRRPTHVQFSGSTLSRGYDNMGRLANQSATGPWGQTTWVGTYDDRGRLVHEALTDTDLGNWSNLFQYAEPGWLEMEYRGQSGDVHEYDYDAAGRRTAKWTNGTQVNTLTWNGSIPDTIDGTALAYDGLDGVDTDQLGYGFDRLADGHVDAIYDDTNALLMEMVRDADGLVVEADEGGTHTRLTTWGLRQGEYPLEVRDALGGDRSYVVADGLLLGAVGSGGFEPAFGEPGRDLLRVGSLVSEETEAFGGPVAAGTERFHFAGLEDVPGAPHLRLAQHRVMDSVGGHFLSTDPIGLGGGAHRTRYADGDPVLRIDPTGHRAFDGERRRKRAKKRKARALRKLKKKATKMMAKRDAWYASSPQYDIVNEKGEYVESGMTVEVGARVRGRGRAEGRGDRRAARSESGGVFRHGGSGNHGGGTISLISDDSPLIEGSAGFRDQILVNALPPGTSQVADEALNLNEDEDYQTGRLWGNVASGVIGAGMIHGGRTLALGSAGSALICWTTGPGTLACVETAALGVAGGLAISGYGTTIATNAAINQMAAANKDDGFGGLGPTNESGGSRMPNSDLKPPTKRGKAPKDPKTNKSIELHHRGQDPDSPLDEMTMEDHRGKGNFGKNHSNTGQSKSKIDRSEWKKEQRRYWNDEWDNGRWEE